jgi:hypothetical protein
VRVARGAWRAQWLARVVFFFAARHRRSHLKQRALGDARRHVKRQAKLDEARRERRRRLHQEERAVQRRVAAQLDRFFQRTASTRQRLTTRKSRRTGPNKRRPHKAQTATRAGARARAHAHALSPPMPPAANRSVLRFAYLTRPRAKSDVVVPTSYDVLLASDACTRQMPAFSMPGEFAAEDGPARSHTRAHGRANERPTPRTAGRQTAAIVARKVERREQLLRTASDDDENETNEKHISS